MRSDLSPQAGRGKRLPSLRRANGSRDACPMTSSATKQSKGRQPRTQLVIPRESGGSSTPRLLGSIITVSGILGHPPSRVTTTEYDFAISPHHLREFCFENLPLKEGAGNAGCLLHPRSRVQLCAKSTHTSIQEQPEHSGIPCAMALRLASCSPRRTALLPPSSPKA